MSAGAAKAGMAKAGMAKAGMAKAGMAKLGAAEFDAFSETYDAAVNRSIAFTGLDVDFFTRAKVGYIEDILAERFADPGTLDMLDVGCGVGNSHRHLAGFTRTLSGCDVSVPCIATARAKNPGVAYDAYDGVRLPYTDASFDIAFTICVMHHVPPPRWTRFAAEMRRVLRPGGLALVFEHNPYNPLTRRAVANCIFDADAVLLAARRSRQLLAEVGLIAVRSAFILTVPAAGPMMRRIDRLFARLPIGAQYVTEGRA